MSCNRNFFYIHALVALGFCIGAGLVQAGGRCVPPQAGDRIVIVAPHPDDEVLAASGLIQQAVAVGAQVHVIYLTNGDHNQSAFQRFSQHRQLTADRLALGEQRRSEAEAAMRLLGLTADNLTFLGYPDWYTLRLWQDFWEVDEVLYDHATGSTDVPYPDDFGYKHPYRADNITTDLCKVLRAFKPTRVFATHPCDTNPDHRAVASFVQLALLELETEGLHPVLDFYIVHFGNWPTPLQYHPALTLDPPPTLRNASDWVSLPLTAAQVHRKYLATLTNQTQIATDKAFLTAFARANEEFTEIRMPTVPLLPAEAELDWSNAPRLAALAVLPSECGYETNGIAALPAATTVMDLKSVDFVRQDDALIAQVELQNLGGQRADVRLYLFGYKQGVAFASLPKVQINITPAGHLTVLSNREAVEDAGVTLTNANARLLLRVPLKLLGGSDLDHLFTAARAYCGAKIADDTAWHLLRLEPAPKN